MGQWRHAFSMRPHMPNPAPKGSICFLLDMQARPHNDNHVRLPKAFEMIGWRVAKAAQASLCLEEGRVCVRHGGLACPLDSFDVVWHLGLGSRHTFLDRMELLSTLPSGLFVTPPRALALKHGKLHLGEPLLRELTPETLVSSDLDYLLSRMRDGEWVIKPPADSFGRGVQRVSLRQSNLRETLNTAAASGFLVVQKYVPANGPEMRVLFAGGHAMRSYGREPTSDFRANLSRGSVATELDIEAQSAHPVAAVEAWLQRKAIGFAAADFRDNRLIEINIANPGGLATIEKLTGRNASIEVAKRIARKNGA